MGIVWCWISIQTATSSGPVRATSSAPGTARTLPLPFSPFFYIFTLLPPAYWILPSIQGFCTFGTSQTFLTCDLTNSIYGLGVFFPCTGDESCSYCDTFFVQYYIVMFINLIFQRGYFCKDRIFKGTKAYEAVPLIVSTNARLHINK